MDRRKRNQTFLPKNRGRKRTQHKETSARKRILIVTEGEKTEVSYFKALKYNEEFSNVEIRTARGNAPVNVIKSAEKMCKDFELVFCVFDQDTISKYPETIDSFRKTRNQSIKSGIEFVAIPSIPCFEFWYLIRFKDKSRSYSGSPSPCSELIKDLRKVPVFENYDKSKSAEYFKLLAKHQKRAISKAQRILSKAKKDGVREFFEDPSTRVHIVVQALYMNSGRQK